jgi:hypothetical protein
MKSSNKIFGTVGLTFALVIAAGCASSPDTTSSGYGATEAIEGDPDRMVCRRDKETGSRLSSRTCKTAREWEEERLLNQEEMRNAQRGGAGPSDMPAAGGG